MVFHYSNCGDAKTFARNLKLQRSLVQGLSQSRLARNLGVSRNSYARYENGTRLPPGWFVVKAAAYFGVTVEELYEKEV